MIQEKRLKRLGASDILVPPLGIGTNKWTYGKNNEPVTKAYHAYLDADLNFIDTAEIYGFGKSERLLGECIKQDARPAVIASKYMPLPTHQFMKALDGSLARLGVQTIDLYYIHFPLGNVEKLMDLMAQAVREGKVRAVGVSNYSAEQMRRAAARLARYDIPLAANQVQYNLMHRQPEVNGVLDACRELNVSLVAYRPLGGGLFTKGKAVPKQQAALQTTLTTIAQQRGKSISQVALNWLLHGDEHVIPIPGASSAAHALENADTLTWSLSDEEFAAIDKVSSPWKG